MRSVQLIENGQPLAVRDVEDPSPRRGEVIVAVEHCGVCHTDLHLHEGRFDLGNGRSLSLQQSLPLTLGHEIQGRVAALGGGVDGLELGQRVAVFPWIGCGDCGLCRSGRENLCGRARAIGVNVDGGYAERVRVPHARYVLPIEQVDGAQAALLMCSGLSAYSALSKVEHAFSAGLPVALIGLGGLGLMALEIARARFGRLPVVLDIQPDKLALAQARGAETIDLADADAHKAFRSRHGAAGAVIDFVGAEATSAMAGRLSGQAGHIVIVGLFGGALSTPLPLLALRGTTIQGSYTGNLDDARACLALAERGALDAVPLSRCRPEGLNAALQSLRDGGVAGRFVLEMS